MLNLSKLVPHFLAIDLVAWPHEHITHCNGSSLEPRKLGALRVEGILFGAHINYRVFEPSGTEHDVTRFGVPCGGLTIIADGASFLDRWCGAKIVRDSVRLSLGGQVVAIV